MDIDYNKLKSFLAVVDAGSVTAAARHLKRTQPAVSQALLGLEQQLGLKLIRWKGKSLQLTREGRIVYQAAKSRLDAIEEQLDALTTSSQEVGGLIEIGVLQDHSTTIQKRLYQAIAGFREQYPAVIFHIHFNTSVWIEEALLDQKIDFGLLINFRWRHRFHTTEVASEEHIVAASSQYLKNKKNPTTVKEALALDLIDIDPFYTCLTPWAAKNSRSALKILEKKKPVATAADFLAIRALLLLQQGIAVIPKYLIIDDLKKGKMLQILPNLPTLRVGVDLAFEKGRQERLCETLFKEML